jgi:quinol monooxygenase YgiN
MYALLARFTAQAGKQPDLAAILVRGTTVMGKATGLIQYLIYTGAEETVWVSELWETKDEHDASLALPGVRALIGEAMPLIAGMESHPLELVGGIRAAQ